MSWQIASASNDVKIWDVTENCEMILKSTTSPLSHPVTSISWNHTNQVVATACDTPSKISLFQSMNGQILSTLPFSDMESIPPIYDIHSVKSLCFSSNSRYLACGIGGYVHLWDLKRKVLKYDSSVSSTVKGQIKAITYLSDANDIITGDSFGYMRLWNSRYPSDSSMSDVSMLYKDGIGVTCLQLPALGSTKLASGYEDGSLVVWDPTTLTQLRAQSIHRSSMTCLGFSPKNSRLIATVGIDGTLTLIDIAAKASASSTPSASVNVGDEALSLSFHEDAIHTAVGTRNGQVLFYDWRNVKKPVFKIDAHPGSPVNALKFQVFPTISKSAVPSVSAMKASVPESPFTPDAKKASSTVTEPVRNDNIGISQNIGVAQNVDTKRPNDQGNNNADESTKPSLSRSGSSFVDSSLNRINEMFPTTPSRSKLEVSEAARPTTPGPVFVDEVSERFKKIQTNTAPVESTYTTAPPPEPDTQPARNIAYDSFKIKTLSDLHSPRRSSTSATISNKESDRLSPKQSSSSLLSTSSSFRNETIKQTSEPPATSSSTTISPKAANLSIDTQSKPPPTVEELRQQYGLPSKQAKRESISNTLSFSTMGSEKEDNVKYEVNPFRGKAAKYDVDNFEDNPMHARSPKYEVDSFEDNPMRQRSFKYEVDSFEDNPMAKLPPPSPAESIKRRASSTNSAQSPKAANIKAAIRAAVHEPVSSLSNETKQSSSDVMKTPSKKPSKRSSSTPTGQVPGSAELNRIYTSGATDRGGDEYNSIKKAVRPVTNNELDNALDMLKYDLHKEIKVVVKEVVRQFDISRRDTIQEVARISMKLEELTKANQELRDENERLRRIY